MRPNHLARGFAVLLGAVLLVTAGACTSGGKPANGTAPAPQAGGGGPAGASATSSGKKLTVAFLMPCGSCAERYAQQDTPRFISAVHAIDPGATVIAKNAGGSGATQISQATAAIDAGAGALVVSPVDKATGIAVVAKAKTAGVPVISYDSLITGTPVGYYVSFDGEKAGELQGQYLAGRLAAAGTAVAIINGDQSTAQGRATKAGLHKVLDPLFASGKLRRGYEAQASKNTATTGQNLARQALSKSGSKLGGIAAATDELAAGASAAVTGAHRTGKVTVTGAGVSDAGLRRLLLGTQSMTVYQAIKQEAEAAAKIAIAAAHGNAAAAKADTKTTVDNGSGEVPAVLLTPIVVTSFNIGQTVLADGYTTRQSLCTAEVKDKCPA